MTIYLIHNPASGSAAQADLVRGWALSLEHVRRLETEGPGHARDLARAAADRGDRLVVAGGDGTVHEVVNGMLESERRDSVLALLPLGTGNDLARGLGIPLDVEAALPIASRGAGLPLDVLRATLDGAVRHAVNALTGGFSGRAAEAGAQAKERWGPLAYARGAVEVLAARTWPTGWS